MHHALFRAFFEEGLDLNDLDVLLTIGTGVGLEREELRATLETGQYTQRVIEDERQASELGITGVPTMLITLPDQPLEQAIVVSGAQPYESVRSRVERVLQKKTARA
jgi:predicted DsbA family dithiol-disulfide isomerase